MNPRYIFLFLLLLSQCAGLAQDTTRVETYQRMGRTYHIVSDGKQYGILSDTGKVILPIRNTSIRFLAPPEERDCSRWSDFLKIQQGPRYALAELSGRPLTPMAYESIELLPETCESTVPGTMVCRVRKNGSYGLLQADGGLLIRCSYNQLDLIKNKKEQLTIPAVVRVRRGKKYGCMVLETKKILPSEYEQIRFFQETKEDRKYTTWLLLKAGGVLGLFNTRDNTFIRPEYEQILPFSGEPELALIVKNKKYGFIDKKGKQQISGFDYAEPFRGAIAIAKKRKRMGAINAKGKSEIPFDYDKLAFFLPEADPEQPKLSQLLKARYKGKWGILTAEGKWFVEPEWARIRFDTQKASFVCEPENEKEAEQLVPLY